MRNHTTPRRGITIARPGFVMTLIHMIKRFRAPIFLGLVVYMIVGFRAPAGNTSMPEAAAPNVIPGRMYETNHADIDERKVQVAANQNVWKGDPAGINTDNIRQEMQQNADDRKDSNKDIYDESDNNPSYKHEDENLEDTERERERLEAR
ncbi:hypothetical protein SARC_03344 [Sphaeroforma arctica JP610]|uniref:Uncharacterized protein n=1 Tax=Sphaeroforma arctica JP610 TaxID=667725 RepID=A0A0L0G677_9EUKA|nr:hypothetical protein SARC_03344 [Sphaeroforma arctica JP610]KNC84449.1 hypothetical protein SARC_03344 [Sphaeroforma arctica JP610]|eukprot:XP_014158351.1 hypothetical protein SARC_03344 [Sphaeroforma arctica JP610]